jgi:uncharacterized protein YlzI (FlbEa/FlbD family)
MTALRVISEQYRGLLDLAKTDDLPIEAIKDTLDGIEGEFNDKALKIVDVISSVEGDIAQIDAEIDRLTARKKTIVNRNQSIRDYLQNNMEACGITKIECPLFTITLAAGRDIVVIDNEDELPDEYIAVKTSTAPDKKELLKALKIGAVAGAHIEKSKSSLRIK